MILQHHQNRISVAFLRAWHEATFRRLHVAGLLKASLLRIRMSGDVDQTSETFLLRQTCWTRSWTNEGRNWRTPRRMKMVFTLS